ncbi:MAG: hypothetical protein Kow0029_28060 [Candidatus Rifleibacteriota bacterium]
MPEAFKARFSSYKKSFLQGATDPDTLIKDFNNHVYYPDGSHPDGMYRIKAIYSKARDLITENQGNEKIAYVLGLMSHYIADLNQPLHTAGFNRDLDESAYHSAYETDVNKYLRNLTLPALRPNLVNSIEERVREMTAQAFKHYDEIGMSYRAGTNLKPLAKMTEDQINASIQNVIDFWCTVFRDSGIIFGTAKTTTNTVAWDMQTQDKDSGKKININNASVEKLSEFFRISREKARQIVDCRPYRTAYDLAKSKVFNPMYIKRNKDKIRLK